MTVVGDVARVIDCEHKTAPRSTADVYGYSIGTRDVRNGRISLASAKPVTRSTFEEWTRRAVPTPGDIILSREAPMGEVGLVPAEAPVCLGQRTVLLQVDQARIEPKFLKYSIMAPAQQHWVQENSLGTTVLHLNVADVREIPIPYLPSVEEQQRIVDLLEDHLSRLDAADAYLATAGRRLDALTTAVLLDAIPDVAEYPASWERSTTAGAGTVELGRQRHPDWHTGPNMRPYLRVANVFEDRIDTSDVMQMHWPAGVFERFQLHDGDVLLNEGQSPDYLGRPAIYRGEPAETAFTNSLIRFRASGRVLPEFALLVFRRHMRSGRFKQESRITTNIAHLSAARLKSIEFPVPPLEEQTVIVSAVRDQFAAIDRMRVEVRQSASHAPAIRRSLLAAAFSGRLTGGSLDISEGVSG